MTLFDQTFKEQVSAWNNSTKNDIAIALHLTDHPETRQFETFAGMFTAIASQAKISPEKSEKELPGFQLTPSIYYSALPFQKELDPFLEALTLLGDKKLPISSDIQSRLEKIDIPVSLKLFIALACPHCPQVIRTVLPLAMACEHLHLHIIDGTEFPEAAQKEQVMSAPCLILDDDFRWTGEVTGEEIIEIITSRDPSNLSATTLKNILEQGDASWITQQMIEKQEIFNGFIQLLLHETWSVRLGAMVIVEALAEEDPGLALQLSPRLMDLFDNQAIPVQGDILYVLGEAGSAETKKWILGKMNVLEQQDLIDAAQEALSSLDESQ